MRIKFFIYLLINSIFTLANQIVYHYMPVNDSSRYIIMAKQYSGFYFFDKGANSMGHTFYAAFLAVIGSVFFSYHQYVIGFVQTLLFTSAAVLLVGELEVYTKKRLTGVLVFLFLIPEIQIYNGEVLTESLGFSLVLLIYWIALKIVNKGATPYRILAISFFMGCSVLNRFETSVCFVPMVFLIWPQIKNKFALYFAVLLLFPSVFIIGNGYKNYRTYNDFKLTAYNGNFVIFSGNNENLDGSNHNFVKYKDIFIPKDELANYNKILTLPLPYQWHAMDSFYMYLAVKAWKKDPVAQIEVIPYKLAKNWLLPGNFDVYTQDTTKAKGLLLSKILSKENFNNNPIAPAKHLFYMLIHFTILIILLTGIWHINRKNRFQLSVMILLGLNLLLTIPFCGLPRWHVIIFPILVIAFIPISLINRLNLLVESSLTKIVDLFAKNSQAR
jgi:hypothetical protein